jgi:hypothetical protein
MEEEKEKILTSSQEIKGKEAHTIVSQRNYHWEHSNVILTQWEEELRML